MNAEIVKLQAELTKAGAAQAKNDTDSIEKVYEENLLFLK
jgi:hypothetical protein